MPPHSLLRALKHRSTPTLPSETSTQPTPSTPVRMVLTPSIFITVPFEEGGHFWCLFPGSACPVPLADVSSTRVTQTTASTVIESMYSMNTSGSGFDVPLPDFAAIEDTIDRLRRAGETPTFRRPNREDEVVLPKKKYSHAHGHVHGSAHENQRQEVETSARVWPRRPRTAPSQRSSTDDEEEISVKEKATKKRKSRPPPLTSISYESVVSQPFSPTSPEAYHVTPPKQEPKKRRSSLGWLFSSNKRPTVRKEGSYSMEAVNEVEDTEREVQFAQRREHVQEMVTLEQVLEGAMPMSPADSSHTTESDVHKPLPPLPPSRSQSQEMPVEGDIDTIPLAIYLAKDLPEEPIQEPETITESKSDVRKESSEGSRPSTPGKLKKKFSLKRLRERFMSSPTPPVPDLSKAMAQAVPKVIVGIAGVPREAIDPPFTPPSIPSLDSISMTFPVMSSEAEVAAMLDEESSGPIDPPFNAPPIPSLSFDKIPAIPVLMKDEDADLSTSSEDSTNTNSSGSSAGSARIIPEITLGSNTSTPESSPPDTPEGVSFGPVFGIQQGVGLSKLSMEITNPMEKMGAAVVDGGIPRSNGVRTKLASLHFDQLDFDTMTF